MADEQDRLNLEDEVRELFAAKMLEFVAFCGANWAISEVEAKTLGIETRDPAAYAQGYTAAMTGGLTSALEYWLREEWE